MAHNPIYVHDRLLGDKIIITAKDGDWKGEELTREQATDLVMRIIKVMGISFDDIRKWDAK